MWTPPCDIYMYLDAQGRYSATPGRTLIFLSQIKCAAQGVSHFTNSHAECNGINSPSFRPLWEAGAQEAAHGLHAHREAGHVLDVVLLRRSV